MKFKMVHENYNVADLDKAMRFYEEALGLKELRRKTSDEHIIVYMGNDESDFELELTWLKDHPQKYDIGEEEFHLVAPILHPEDDVVAVGVAAIMLVHHSPCCQVRWREMLAPCWRPKHDQLPMFQAPDGRHFHLSHVITITDLKVVGAGEGP